MQPTPDLAAVRRALATVASAVGPDLSPGPRAAVAAVLRAAPPGLEMLFIHRADHPRDPWSGHMAWPGGRVEAADASPLAAAVRETREELGLDLDRDAEVLGRLGETRTHLRRGPAAMTVAPFVFALHGDVRPTPNREVQQVLWVPLAFLLDRANRSHLMWTRHGVPVPMPCYRFAGQTIWGLTLHMLDELLALLRAEGRRPGTA